MKINLLILNLLLISSFGCGQKSKITPIAKPVKLAQTIGDGEFVVMKVVLPLSDRTLDAIEPLLDEKGVKVPLFGDFAHMLTKSIYNFGANKGMGRMLLRIDQPIPDLNSDILHSIKVKRIFFNVDKKDALEKKEDDKETVKSKFKNAIARFRQWLRGGKDPVDLSFLREIKLRVSSTNNPVNADLDDSSIDIIQLDDMKLQQWNKVDDGTHELLDYKRDEKTGAKVLGNKIIVHSDDPVVARNFFLKDAQMKEIVTKATLINKSILVELNDEEMVVERFINDLEEREGGLDQLKILKMNQCTDVSCIDFELKDENLKPIVSHGNRFLIETYIDVSKVPSEAFQLKGFVEFEVKLDLPI